MMRAFSWMICFLIGSAVLGQNGEEFYYEWRIQWIDFNPVQCKPSKGVNKITFVQNRKGTEKTYVKEYNDEAQVTEYYSFDKKGQRKNITLLKYNEAGAIEESRLFKKGKLKKIITYQRREDGKPLAQQKVNAKGVILLKDEWIYGDEDCLLEYRWYKRGGDKVSYKWVHEYRSGCDKSKSTFYNGRGKVKGVWTYNCKEEGQIQELKKNTTQVCRWEETSKDTLVQVYQSVDDKGRAIRYVKKYTRSDTLILESKMYDHKDRLIYKIQYDKSMDRITYSAGFRKGKERRRMSAVYDQEKISSRSHYRKGKLIRKSTYVYNDDNSLAEFKKYDKKGGIYKTIRLSYN